MKATPWALLKPLGFPHNFRIHVQGEQHIGVLIIEVFAFRPVGRGADGQYHDTVLDDLLIGERGGKVAHHAVHFFNNRIEMHRNVGVRGHLADHRLQARGATNPPRQVVWSLRALPPSCFFRSTRCT